MIAEVEVVLSLGLTVIVVIAASLRYFFKSAKKSYHEINNITFQVGRK